MQLTADENKILAIKYRSRPLAGMDDRELTQTATLLLLRIHVIAGWAVPEKELKKILVEQFVKKIKESYQNVNSDEIEYAFRQNTTVKDWGKSINLVLIDEVLRDYLEKRLEVSRKEENFKELPEPTIKDDDVLDDEDFIAANKAVYRLTGTVGMVSAKCYDMLLKTGRIKRPEGENRQRIIKIAESHFFSPENKENVQGMTVAECERLINQDCKRIMVCEWFNTQA